MGMGGHWPERTVSDKQTLQIFKAEGRGKGKRKKKKNKTCEDFLVYFSGTFTGI